jgi:acyl-[acyl-carrier-protein]-phospholipid O-acyltransferase/long-chain-fatty-acid--[acyl-carrier-protein] ligase
MSSKFRPAVHLLRLDPENTGELVAVVAVPDARKGEQLVLVTTRADAEIGPVLAAARTRGIPEIMVPRTLLRVDAVPLLGTGKVDYPEVAALVARSGTAS